MEQAPLAIEDLMNELDSQSEEGEAASDGDEESSEDEQDLQDTPPRRLPAGEEPRNLAGLFCLLLSSPESLGAWHKYMFIS